MRVSINVTSYSWPGRDTPLRARLAAIAGAADDSGLDTVWVADHLLQVDPRSTPEAPILGIEHAVVITDEAWTPARLATLGNAAALLSAL